MNSSILYKDEESYSYFDKETVFADLHIDQIVEEIVNIRKKNKIKNYFIQKPNKEDDLLFRLAIIKELERPDVYNIVRNFVQQYNNYKLNLHYSETLSQRQTKQKWYLDAAYIYCHCLVELKDSFLQADLKSEGLQRFLLCLVEYMNTDSFVLLNRDMILCNKSIKSIRYIIDIDMNQNKVKVVEDSETTNFIDELGETFQRFNCDAFNTQIIALPGVNMCTLELSILDSLNHIYFDEFTMLDNFYKDHISFGHEFIDSFEIELQFYLSYIDYMERFKEKGYSFSYPNFSKEKGMKIEEGYALSLAQIMLKENRDVTVNDFEMATHEKHFVITGPNQGGKTTYARMFGQILYFVSIGLPAPCKSIETYFIERLYTHFAREEDLSTNYGRLKEELVRIKQIFDTMPRNSVIIFNEIFSSTTSFDAYQMGKKILQKFIKQDSVCLFVTHIHELAKVNPHIVSLYTDDTQDKRAYKLIRGPVDNILFSNDLMYKYHLYYNDIKERMK